MQVHTAILLLGLGLVAMSEGRPHFTNYALSNYEYPTAELNAEPQYLQYQDPFSPYYFYNVHPDIKTIPTAVLSNGKPAINQIPSYNFYYQPPVYDFPFPLSPVYPVLRPQQPGALPKPVAPPAAPPAVPPMAPPTTTTPKPQKDEKEDEDDGIEKLDLKAEPETETKKPTEKKESDEDDSVTVEAI